MMSSQAIEVLARKAEQLRALHQGPGLLVLPNAWDAASARVVEAAGFAAIATTSGGVAQVLGYADGEKAPVGEMAGAAARITAAVAVPVIVDFEAGYQLSSAEVVRRLIMAGAAGMNIEDSDHHDQTSPLLDADFNAERLAELKTAAAREGVNLVLNARVDVFVRQGGPGDQQRTEALRRAKLYKEAGADCIYPITLADEAIISELVSAVGTLNVNLRPGGLLSLKDAQRLGVRRVSYATSIFRQALATTQQVVSEIYQAATSLQT